MPARSATMSPHERRLSRLVRRRAGNPGVTRRSPPFRGLRPAGRATAAIPVGPADAPRGRLSAGKPHWPAGAVGTTLVHTLCVVPVLLIARSQPLPEPPEDPAVEMMFTESVASPSVASLSAAPSSTAQASALVPVPAAEPDAAAPQMEERLARTAPPAPPSPEPAPEPHAVPPREAAREAEPSVAAAPRAALADPSSAPPGHPEPAAMAEEDVPLPPAVQPPLSATVPDNQLPLGVPAQDKQPSLATTVPDKQLSPAAPAQGNQPPQPAAWSQPPAQVAAEAEVLPLPLPPPVAPRPRTVWARKPVATPPTTPSSAAPAATPAARVPAGPSVTPSTAAPALAAAAPVSVAADPAPAASAALQAAWARAIEAWIAQHRIYPEPAKRRGIQGSVVLRFSVDRSGRVTEVVLLRGSGSAILDAAAEAMLRDAMLPPPPRDHVTVSVPVHYALID
jgi:protein TonB